MLGNLLTLSNNTGLPEISAWKVKSFWLQVLMVGAVLLNYLGVDLMVTLKGMGLGGSPEEVVATGERAVGAVQQLIPIVLGIWTWFERRAPKFRLILWPKSGAKVGQVALILLSLMIIGGGAGAALAAECGPVAKLQGALRDDYHEQLGGAGQSANGTTVQLWYNPDTLSWTALAMQGETACIVDSGENWQVMDVTPGSPT